MLPSELKPGDKVRSLRRITEGPTEDFPGQLFCECGDELVIREHRTEATPFSQEFWPLSVSHKHITDRSFGVNYADVDVLNAVR